MESYIPLLDSLYELKNEGISPHITLSLTPVLCEQLSHPGFGPALVNYIQEKIDFARHNSEEFQRHGNSHKAWLADWWLDFYTRAGESFTNTYRKDLIAAFKTLQDEGHIEIITSGGHSWLPAPSWL